MAYRVTAAGGKVREIPIEFRDRRAGRSKMSSHIVVEALWLVTKWGVARPPHAARPDSSASLNIATMRR